jgi:hypothetical protein
MEHVEPVGVELVEAPGAPLGRADLTRRWALRFPDGRERFPGVTRPEGEAAARALADLTSPVRALVEVFLPALLSEGAGPHLLDAEGRLVLALGAHPRVPGVRVAMGEPAPAHRIGAVRPLPTGGGVWAWAACADVPPAERVEALDALDAAPDADALRAWEGAWRRRGT